MAHKLQIALVLETSGGGSGRHVLDLASGLASRGHSVTVVWSPTRATDDFQKDLREIPDLTLKTLPMSRSVGLQDRKALKAMTALFEQLPAMDVIHAHSSKAGALTRLLPKRIAGSRVYTPHAFRTMDPKLGRPQRFIYGTIERVLAAKGQAVIAVSQFEYDHALELGIAPNCLHLVVNGAGLPRSTNRATARADMGLTENDFVVGFVGRLVDQKDPLRFVEALNLAHTQNTSIKGVVLGDGALRAACEQMALPNSVSFLGWQDAPSLIKGFDVFTMTSRYEAMPYTLIEALHARLPIITSDVGGALETVRHGQNGALLPLDATPEVFAAAILDLANTPGKLAAYQATSEAMAQMRTIGVMVDQTEAVYKSLT
ncbi:MAG: glycosyltransferase family 4 protein [Pseudomonadota bacterium]